MNQLRHGLSGILAAFGTMVFVIGAISLSIVEGGLNPLISPTIPPTLPAVNLTPLGFSLSPTPTLFVTETLPPPPTSCPVPNGWLPYSVLPGDTISLLAQLYAVSEDAIMQGNCLVSTTLLPGTIVYLPSSYSTETQSVPVTASGTPTRTPISCGPPTGWIRYAVKQGDTLTRISILYGTSVWQIKNANCLYSDLIQVGQLLWVPNVATRTLTFTPVANTPLPSSTPAPTSTPTPLPTTATEPPPATVMPIDTAEPTLVTPSIEPTTNQISTTNP